MGSKGAKNMTTKQTIPYEELLKKVQSLLASFTECQNIHINGIEVYQEQADGANWHLVNFQRSGDDNDLVACREKIIAEIRLLRKSYDVADQE
jgi:hypothetical protein